VDLRLVWLPPDLQRFVAGLHELVDVDSHAQLLLDW
jgi:hypothetical protein